MYEALQTLDSLRLNFSDGGLLSLNIAIAVIMFGVALNIQPDDFVKLFRNPKPAFVGIVSQFVLLPAFTFLLVFLLGDIITPGIGMGMILVAACPGGNISNFISTLAKANVALSVSLTAFATIAAVMLTPFNFMIWGKAYAATSDLVRPIEIPVWEMFKTVFILLGIPLAVGMIFKWKLPNLTMKLIKPMKIFSIVVFMGVIVLAFLNNIDYFLPHIKYIFILVLIHNALALSVGYFASKLMKLGKRNARTIAIETGIQNSALALVLIFNPNIFPADLPTGGMMFIAAWWGIWHMFSGFGLAFLWSRGNLGADPVVEPLKSSE
jgi:bile acid:Na+ symporter, BASS family